MCAEIAGCRDCLQPFDWGLHGVEAADIAEFEVRCDADAGDFGGLPYGAIAAGDADLIAEAVDLLVEMPRVEAAMANATQACENELSEQSYAEQQRLVQRRLALRARLGHMGRARAAL